VSRLRLAVRRLAAWLDPFVINKDDGEWWIGFLTGGFVMKAHLQHSSVWLAILYSVLASVVWHIIGESVRARRSKKAATRG
jgi:hypothetical protein